MPAESLTPEDVVRRAGRRYVPERALLTGAPGGPALSGVTTVSDLSSDGVGLLQTYPMETGLRFMLLQGQEKTRDQIYEVVYCREHSGVFRIGARSVGVATPVNASSLPVTSSSN